MIVELDAGELALARMLASMRHATARVHGVKDARLDNKMSDLEIDEVGMIAELAWCKYANCYPDLTVGPRSLGHDAVTNGKRVDIKASKLPKARLLARKNKVDSDVEVYVLGVVDGPVVDFKGWATKEQLIRPENLGDLGRGEGYILDQGQLCEF